MGYQTMARGNARKSDRARADIVRKSAVDSARRSGGRRKRPLHNLATLIGPSNARPAANQAGPQRLRTRDWQRMERRIDRSASRARRTRRESRDYSRGG